MAANGPDDKGKAGGQDKDAPAWNMDAIPEAMREAGKRAADLAQNPYARSLFAAGLVAATAALAANKNVRETTRKNLRDATDAAGVAAENAGKIGAAIIEAATDAVQRMLSLSADMAGAAGAAAQGQSAPAAPAAPTPPEPPVPPPAPQRRASAPKAAERKTATAKAGTSKAATAAGGNSSSKADKAPAKKAGSKTGDGKSAKSGATAGRKRAPKKDS
jgi:cobalamin biosynthesis Mg chelatase CobN